MGFAYQELGGKALPESLHLWRKLMRRAGRLVSCKRSFRTLGSAGGQTALVSAQCQGMSSSMRLLGQPWTRRVSRSVR